MEPFFKNLSQDEASRGYRKHPNSYLTHKKAQAVRYTDKK